jgi:hypothetical protein
VRIRLLAAVGGRPAGAEFDHDQAGAEALISAGFAEQVEQVEHQEQPAGPPAEPVPTGPGESAVPAKRSRTPRRG